MKKGTEPKRPRFHGMYDCAGGKEPIGGASRASDGDRGSGWYIVVARCD